MPADVDALKARLTAAGRRDATELVALDLAGLEAPSQPTDWDADLADVLLEKEAAVEGDGAITLEHVEHAYGEAAHVAKLLRANARVRQAEWLELAEALRFAAEIQEELSAGPKTLVDNVFEAIEPLMGAQWLPFALRELADVLESD